MPLSTAGLRALLARESSDAILILITITIGATTLRFVDNPVDVTSNSNLFTAYPFKLSLASDADHSPEVKIQIGNIDRQIMLAIADVTTPPEFLIQVIIESEPNTVQQAYSQFTLREVNADALLIEGTLGQARISTEIWPKIRATKARCPSLVR